MVLAITTGKKKVPVVCLADCAVVSVFGSGDYDRKKKKFQSSVWRVVLLCQFLVLAITTGKKKVPVVCLAGCAVVSVFGSGDYDQKKKVLVVCLAGAQSLLRPEKKLLVVCLAGAQSSLRPKKKSSSHLSGGCAIVITTGKKKVLVICLAGCAVVSVFGSGRK